MTDADAQLWTRVQEGATFTTLLPFMAMVIVGTVAATVALVRMRRDVGWAAAPAYLLGFVLTSGEFPTWVSVPGAALQLVALVAVVRAALRH